MKNLIKKSIKKILSLYGWKLSKNYKNKSYTNQKPNLKLLEALHAAKGIFHLGAHRGTEAAVYNWLHKRALWIEANPEIFVDLKENVSKYINQKAFNILLFDSDNKVVKFNISNNDGASSSIYEFGDESKKQNLRMVESINLKSQKIDTFFEENKINCEDYDFWVIDLQGSELPVLKGAQHSLKKCNYIYVEISKGEYYKDATQWHELNSFLKKFNFQNLWEPENSHTDVLFKKSVI